MARRCASPSASFPRGCPPTHPTLLLVHARHRILTPAWRRRPARLRRTAPRRRRARRTSCGSYRPWRRPSPPAVQPQPPGGAPRKTKRLLWSGRGGGISDRLWRVVGYTNTAGQAGGADCCFFSYPPVWRVQRTSSTASAPGVRVVYCGWAGPGRVWRGAIVLSGRGNAWLPNPRLQVDKWRCYGRLHEFLTAAAIVGQ